MIKGFEMFFSDAEKKQILSNIETVLSSGMVIDYTFHEKLRTKLKMQTGKSLCTFSSSNTMATELLYRSLSYRKIYFQGNQFVSPIFAARRAGMEVDFIDIELESISMDYDSLIQKDISNSIICLMHTGGIINKDIHLIQSYCREYNNLLVEDCAQSFCSTFNGTDSGSFADYSIFSFAATKIFTSISGGAVLHDDEDVHKIMTALINCGKRTPFGEQVCDYEGFSARLTEIQSAMLCGIDIDRRLKHRKDLADIYNDALTILEYEGKVRKIYNNEGTNYYKYMVLLNSDTDIEGLEYYAESNGWQISGPVYRQIPYKTPVLCKEFINIHLPHTEDFCAHHVCLPLHENMTLEDAEKVANSFYSFSSNTHL